MTQIYTAQIQQRGEWWIGWVREIPGVNCQEKPGKNYWKHWKLRCVKP